MADQLATPEDLAALLQQDLDRATAELLLQCATAVVQNAAGGQRILLVEDDVQTLYLDGNDSSTWLSLPQRPVVSVSAVSLAGTPLSDWSPQLSRGRLFRTYGWRAAAVDDPLTPTTVQVTYTHGYAPDDQRLQLARSAVLSLAAQGYSNPTGATRAQIDDYSVQYAEMGARMEATPHLVRALRRQYGAPRSSVRLVTA